MASADTSAAAPLPSQKRPLEDPTSDLGGSGDQPDAKRPALDSSVGSVSAPANDTTVIVDEQASAQASASTGTASNGTAPANPTNGKGSTNGFRPADQVLHTQPIQSTASLTSNGGSNTNAAMPAQDESGWLHVRAIISSGEAATIIGKGGENVNIIRKAAGAKCTISEYSRGAVERILTISGLVDAVAKAFGLIIRTLNQEPLEESSNADSHTYPLRLLIPHVLIGSIIGQKGVRIREIQEASGARLTASDSCLPLSTERTLIILGVADAVHIATYYVGTTLVNQLTEKFGGPAASAYAGRNGVASGVVPGGMQVVPYFPQVAGGQWGYPSTYNQRQTASGRPTTTNNSYTGQQPQQAYAAQPPPAAHYGGGAGLGYSGSGPAPPPPMQYPPAAMAPQQGGMTQPMGGYPGQPVTQQIYIPNDMVGAIIGKGGQKINEIRTMSGASIKINEPSDNSNERLVTVSGTQECNRMALYLLYQRLGSETEKHRS